MGGNFLFYLFIIIIICQGWRTEERPSAIVNSYQVRAQGREAKGNLYMVFGVSHNQPTDQPSFILQVK